MHKIFIPRRAFFKILFIYHFFLIIVFLFSLFFLKFLCGQYHNRSYQPSLRQQYLDKLFLIICIFPVQLFGSQDVLAIWFVVRFPKNIVANFYIDKNESYKPLEQRIEPNIYLFSLFSQMFFWLV